MRGQQSIAEAPTMPPAMCRIRYFFFQLASLRTVEQCSGTRVDANWVKTQMQLGDGKKVQQEDTLSLLLKYNELARWPALIARVASFLFNSLKIFTLTEEMYFVIYLPLVCPC